MNATRASIVARTDGHLRQLVKGAIQMHGPNVDLNHIDVSGITNFERLFHNKSFTGNVSRWNMARANNLTGMFKNCPFNGDISNWDVRNVQVMVSMFERSQFAGDISRWNVGRVKWAGYMFSNSSFHGDLSGWRMTSLESAPNMFENSLFDGEVSQWQAAKLRHVLGMFNSPHFHGDLSTWRLSNQDTTASFAHMMAPGFRGTLPQLGTAVTGHILHQNLLAPNEDFHTYLQQSPFSHVHAWQLMARPNACPWAATELQLWAKEQIQIGLAIGLNQEEMVAWMVEQQQTKAPEFLAPPNELFHYPV